MVVSGQSCEPFQGQGQDYCCGTSSCAVEATCTISFSRMICQHTLLARSLLKLRSLKSAKLFAAWAWQARPLKPKNRSANSIGVLWEVQAAQKPGYDVYQLDIGLIGQQKSRSTFPAS